MIEFKVNVTPSLEKLAMSFMKGNVATFLASEINRLAASVERFSKQLTPVDSGRLRASIHFDPVFLLPRTVVSTDTDYAIFVHEGTKYMKARPFMQQGSMFAQQNVDGEIAQRLDAEFIKEFKSL